MNMDVTKNLSYCLANEGNGLALIDDENEAVALLESIVSPEHQTALADAITDRYNAPLIILGRSEELRPTKEVQWNVLHDGGRKLMTRSEMEDIMYALEFTE